MLNAEYSLCHAELQDLDLWMKLVEIVRYNFPGLETVEGMNDYRQTLIKNIKRDTAICVKHGNVIVGILLFSYNQQCLSCMAVHPEHRRYGIASAMIEEMISLFPSDMDINVTTFRNDDIKGTAPRALYKRLGFEEGELITEFGYPVQRFALLRK
jgi:ribosomal protein S18 acetylase RimI-like enzyme